MNSEIKRTTREHSFEASATMALMEALPREYEYYLNPNRLYVAHFAAVPCESNVLRVDCHAAAKWFVLHYSSEILQEYRKRLYAGAPSMNQIIFCMKDGIMLQFKFHDESILILYNVGNAEKVDNLIEGFLKFQQEIKVLPEMSVLIRSNGRLDTEVVVLDNYNLDIDTHYNDDFKIVHNIIFEKLNASGGKGLVLLHGMPGTGKTSYLRYLIGTLNKKVIFMPPSIAMEIGEPSLMGLLMDNKNSIFVIEDAESLVRSREGELFSPVSAILNICDGLMSDFLNIQVICTFNTDISKIDSALLRKGRLIALYEFKQLCVDKAQALSLKLGYVTEINRPMALSTVYNQHEKDFEQSQRTVIGFKTPQRAS